MTVSHFALVEESGPDFDQVDSFPSRLQRYEKAHRRALDMASHIKELNGAQVNQNTGHLSALLSECGSYLVFRDYYTVGQIRLTAASFCRKHLLCPLCAIRRGAKALKAYTDRLSIILTDNPTLKPFLVTVTTKNGADLGERFDHYVRSMKRYTDQRREAKKGRRSDVEMSKALGGVSSIEIKRGSGSGLWHVHSHAVWLCEMTPDAVLLAQEWKDVTGDSHIVDVRPFSGNSLTDYLQGFMEVFKYAVKFSSLELSDNWEAFQLLAGRRLVNSFGLFRGVDVPKDLTDELLEDLPYVEMIYRYLDGAGYSFEKPDMFNNVQQC